MPTGYRVPKVCHNLPSLRSQRYLTIPAALGENPQRIGKADGRGFLWFVRALALKHAMCQRRSPNSAERGLAREDLEDVYV